MKMEYLINITDIITEVDSASQDDVTFEDLDLFDDAIAELEELMNGVDDDTLE